MNANDFISFLESKQLLESAILDQLRKIADRGGIIANVGSDDFRGQLEQLTWIWALGHLKKILYVYARWLYN